MKIAIIGFSGNVGQRLTAEAISRGHQVTGIARHIGQASESENLKIYTGNIEDTPRMADLLKNHDVVISSVKFLGSDPYQYLAAVRQSGVKRYLVVGGASSLMYKPGITVLESGHVPDWAIDEAKAGITFLDVLRGVNDIDWTFLSPSALFVAGERTGKFRLGQDDLLVGEDGKSWISYEDFAVAMIDEAESARHLRERFTVGY